MSFQPQESFRRWLLFGAKRSPRLRLFCFPFAGAGASVFRSWPNKLPAEIDVCPIQLPGRESRRLEIPLERIEPLVQALALDLLPLLNVPFAFFGHSMGALVSFELARELRRTSRPMPIHLFASGHRAPQLPDPDPPIHNLPESELLEELAQLNGTHKDVLANLELMRFFLPVMRSDAALCETYRYAVEGPLMCPFSIYGGVDDPKVTREELLAWQQQTTGTVDFQMFPGDHFYFSREDGSLTGKLSESLKLLLGRVP